MLNSKSILIAEDDMMIRTALKHYFNKEGYDVITATDGQEALMAYSKHNIDLVCTNLSLPNLSGWTVIQKIREYSAVPIIVISAEGSEENILKAYNLGIDDFLTKPFNPQILVVKTNNMLNRNVVEVSKKEANILRYGNISLNEKSRVCYIDGVFINLTEIEYELLKFMIQNKNKVLSRNELYKQVWEPNHTEVRIVDVYIKKIRTKIKQSNIEIQTKFGKGYILSPKFEE